jgi:signal transduction histidine kinase
MVAGESNTSGALNNGYETDTDVAQMRLRRLAHNLSERVKELDCLYGISRLFENKQYSLTDTLQGVVDLIPHAWQYPEATCARIILQKNRQLTTSNFSETTWKQTQCIVVNGKRFGMLEVYYLQEMPESDEGPFLKEERELLRVIAERLGQTIEQEIDQRNVQLSYQREREAREKLQAEIKTRIDFTRRLIHELKTPLTSLMATSQLLRDEARNQRISKLADYICNGVNNMNNRIEELHDVTRGELGILKLSPRKIRLNDLLHSLVEETSPLFKQHNMSVVLEVPEQLPIVNADPDRTRQIILNLFNNALKYASEGKIIVVKATKKKKANAILIEVRDYGQGIPLEKQATLFEPRHTPYNNDGTGGLGIGLPLCKVLVELHGGQIWMKSQTGKGSSFFFTIPLQDNPERGPEDK